MSFTGTHTDEAKRKISEHNKKSGKRPPSTLGRKCPPGCECGKHRFSESHKQKISQSCGRRCPPSCTCDRHSEAARQRGLYAFSVARQSPEVQAKKNAAISQRLRGRHITMPNLSPEERQRRSELWKLSSGRGKPGHHNGVWMRCLNSEGVLARELDSVGIQWVYEPKKFKLSWTHYTPDFFLPEFNIYLEVKGWMYPGSQERIDSFRQEIGKTLVVVMQSELPTMFYGGD